MAPLRPTSWAALSLLLAPSVPICAAEPLHARVDRSIEAKAKADGVALAVSADDGEFLRRAWLDFAGTIPSTGEAWAFLADRSPDKRTAAVDRLLSGPAYATRMADLYNAMYMERLGENAEWTQYLRDSFAANKPWDAMAREILRADSGNAAAKGSSFFIAKRLDRYGQNPTDYSGLTRDVGRLFLGKDFRCCECHDHLFIDDYKQKDFQGLYAFFKNAELADAATLAIAEKATTEKTSFASVFTKVPMATAPALPGTAMVEIPKFPAGEEYAIKPDRRNKVVGAPKFSTLAALSRRLPRAENKDFTRNAVNRLWFAVMGRGLVHPLDLHHSRNPASHPELLDLLADEFAGHGFDAKWLLRELALTQTYRRSSAVPAGAAMPDARYFAVSFEKRLTSDQVFAATRTAIFGADAGDAIATRAKYRKAYDNQAREAEDEVAPSLKAALFVLHDEAVLGQLKSAPGNLVDRASKLPDAAAADELYIALLTRTPTADERAAVAGVLAKHPEDRAGAVGRIAWALLASMEFGVNH